MKETGHAPGHHRGTLRRIKMRLGDVLRKERERKRLTIDDLSRRLDMPSDDYVALEAGESPIEEWGQKLAQLAVKLSVPTSRLISETGKSGQARRGDGQCGRLIRAHRERLGLNQADLARQIGVTLEEMVSIEDGKSPLETYAPLLLCFAESVDQPIFNLFFPNGLPLEKQ
jgi:transcriptional regulator with XRE-family HTH domain